MQHAIDPELRAICQDIVDRNQSIDDWRETESGDEFQEELYHGGFEEDAFCFSCYAPDGREFWFEFTLAEAADIAAGRQTFVQLRDADT